MAKIVSGSVGLLVSLVLFMGFAVVDELVPQRLKIPVYVAIAVLFIVQQVYLHLPKPARLSEVEVLRETVEVILSDVLRRYYDTIRQLAETPQEAKPSVRGNVMLPTWRWLRLGRYLRVYYSDGGPPKLAYTGDEMEIKWTRKWPGTCGTAWLRKRVIVYDSETEGLRAPEDKVSPEQMRTIGRVNSVLSVPIWSEPPRKVIGVLNLDSTWNVDRTRFDHQEVIRLLKASAGVVAPLLFADGIGTR